LFGVKVILYTIFFLFTGNNREIWIAQNWGWLAVIMTGLILILFLLFPGDTKRSTKIIKDKNGNTKSITVTEIRGRKV